MAVCCVAESCVFCYNVKALNISTAKKADIAANLIKWRCNMKRTKYPIHPDLKKWSKMNPNLSKPIIPVMQGLMGLLYKQERSTKELLIEGKEIITRDGASLKALLYTPKNTAGKAPCLIYYHGGGFVLPAAPYHYKLAREYGQRAGCKVLFVNYRLAPKHKFPTAPNDCFDAFCFAAENAERLGIDISKIGVAGDSAGGSLATVVCLMARNQGKIMPCGQMLLYPSTGAGQTESMQKYTDTPMCNSRDAKKYDKLYASENIDRNNEYFAPMKAETLQGLPPAYIETAEFDCLHDDGVLYAEKLKKFDVPTTLHNTVGTIHGYDIVIDSPIVRECVDKRIDFLNTIFS